jgi:hypothetical protein
MPAPRDSRKSKPNEYQRRNYAPGAGRPRSEREIILASKHKHYNCGACGCHDHVNRG